MRTSRRRYRAILCVSSQRPGVGAPRRFSSIMPPAALYELVRNTGLGVAGNSGLVDGVLIARGCRPHICPDFVGAIAIELATGRPYALIYNREKGLKVYGATLTDLPEPLRKIAQEWDR